MRSCGGFIPLLSRAHLTLTALTLGGANERDARIGHRHQGVDCCNCFEIRFDQRRHENHIETHRSAHACHNTYTCALYFVWMACWLGSSFEKVSDLITITRGHYTCVCFFSAYRYTLYNIHVRQVNIKTIQGYQLTLGPISEESE